MEKSANAEFFSGSSAKTPERYIKIRNHILDIWERIQPAYVTKTAARNGLRDCGDVNVIGRVHQFLESIGAINVGHAVVQRPPRPPTKRKASDAAETFARAPTFRCERARRHVVAVRRSFSRFALLLFASARRGLLCPSCRC